jgi:hypothetical protein
MDDDTKEATQGKRLAKAQDRIEELEAHQRLLVASLQKTREDLVELREVLDGSPDEKAMFALRGIAETLNQVTGEPVPDEYADGWNHLADEVERLREVPVILKERIAALESKKREDGALPPKREGFLEGLQSAVDHFKRAEERTEDGGDE